MNGPLQKDLVILVADKNMEFAVRGLLSRAESLGARRPEVDVYVHPERDPGCLLRGHEFLRHFVNTYRHALLMFDREGCGQETVTRAQLESSVETQLSQSGWQNRATVIVFDPELEVWVWSDSPHVDEALGWSGRQPDLRTWLVTVGCSVNKTAKPARPKEAVCKALKLARKPRSSSTYLQLAERVSLARCVDPAFHKFTTTLLRWFPS